MIGCRHQEGPTCDGPWSTPAARAGYEFRPSAPLSGHTFQFRTERAGCRGCLRASRNGQEANLEELYVSCFSERQHYQRHTEQPFSQGSKMPIQP
jgi:hypothetical protein